MAAPAIVVNGVYRTTVTWTGGLETGRSLIGYDPQDDLYARLTQPLT